MFVPKLFLSMYFTTLEVYQVKYEVTGAVQVTICLGFITGMPVAHSHGVTLVVLLARLKPSDMTTDV